MGEVTGISPLQIFSDLEVTIAEDGWLQVCSLPVHLTYTAYQCASLMQPTSTPRLRSLPVQLSTVACACGMSGTGAPQSSGGAPQSSGSKASRGLSQLHAGEQAAPPAIFPRRERFYAVSRGGAGEVSCSGLCAI